MSGISFTAIDFETANSHRGSACAVGLVKVRDGHIVDTASWLIKPPPGIEHPSSVANRSQTCVLILLALLFDHEHEPRTGDAPRALPDMRYYPRVVAAPTQEVVARRRQHLWREDGPDGGVADTLDERGEGEPCPQ